MKEHEHEDPMTVDPKPPKPEKAKPPEETPAPEAANLSPNQKIALAQQMPAKE